MRLLVLPILWLTSAGTVLGQGNPSSTAANQDQQRRGGVELGAGSTSNVTTGSSGPQSQPGKTVPPLPVDMARPDRTGPFNQPGALAIQPPRELRCKIIGDGNARTRCEEQARRARERNGG